MFVKSQWEVFQALWAVAQSQQQWTKPGVRAYCQSPWGDSKEQTCWRTESLSTGASQTLAEERTTWRTLLKKQIPELQS